MTLLDLLILLWCLILLNVLLPLVYYPKSLAFLALSLAFLSLLFSYRCQSDLHKLFMISKFFFNCSFCSLVSMSSPLINIFIYSLAYFCKFIQTMYTFFTLAYITIRGRFAISAKILLDIDKGV